MSDLFDFIFPHKFDHGMSIINDAHISMHINWSIIAYCLFRSHLSKLVAAVLYTINQCDYF